MKPFLEALRERILMADGSIGAELYARGIFVNRCFDELVFGEEKLVWQIHQDFFRAGAEVLTTNTFGANRVKLASFGLEGKLEAINKKAVALCKQVSRETAYVLGAVGPLWRERVAPKGALSAEQAEEIFAEQARALAAGGADAISLEGFYDLPEILAAIRAAKATGLPVLAHMAFEALGVPGQDLGEPVAAAKQLVHAGADLIGVYNGGGPQPALDTLSDIHEALPDLPLSAKPSSGAPEVQEGRRFLMATPEFMAEMGRRYAQKGARLVGGGDGVTPAMIKDMTDYMRTLSPRHRPLEILGDAAPEVRPLPRVPLAEKGEWGRILAEGKFAVSVELDPPPGLDPGKSIEGAIFLKEHGIDMINIADGPRAIARMGPRTMAGLVHEATGIVPITHYCCRDRNILAMQMDLIGAHATGFTNLMLITGDPPKMGNAPHATAVFDLDSVGLITMVDRMNQGIDISGRFLGAQTRHVLGTGCNPGSVDLDREVRHFENKVRAGAEFVFSQPVYDPELLETFLKRTEYIEPKIPFFVGILPLASYKNAEFLTANVPGMEVPQDVRDRLRMAGTKEREREEGVKIAQEALRHAKSFSRVRGAYIFPPFGNYKAVLRVLEGA